MKEAPKDEWDDAVEKADSPKSAKEKPADAGDDKGKDQGVGGKVRSIASCVNGSIAET